MTEERSRRISILLERLQGKNIYLYGAGKRGKVALENLCIMGFGEYVAGFLDDNYGKTSENSSGGVL